MDVVQDNRGDSTLDLIAAEELAENQELAAKVEGAQQAEAEQAFEESAAGWRQAVATAGDLITSVLPEAKPVWTDERMDNLGAALARADEAYGWGGAGELFKNPTIGLAIAALPLAWGTGAILKAKMDAAKLAKLRHTQGAQQDAPVLGDMAPGEVADTPAAPAEKLKATMLNPHGSPSFGS
jgi:hypothetical protein